MFRRRGVLLLLSGYQACITIFILRCISPHPSFFFLPFYLLFPCVLVPCSFSYIKCNMGEFQTGVARRFGRETNSREAKGSISHLRRIDCIRDGFLVAIYFYTLQRTMPYSLINVPPYGYTFIVHTLRLCNCSQCTHLSQLFNTHFLHHSFAYIVFINVIVVFKDRCCWRASQRAI